MMSLCIKLLEDFLSLNRPSVPLDFIWEFDLEISNKSIFHSYPKPLQHTVSFSLTHIQLLSSFSIIQNDFVHEKSSILPPAKHFLYYPPLPSFTDAVHLYSPDPITAESLSWQISSVEPRIYTGGLRTTHSSSVKRSTLKTIFSFQHMITALEMKYS